MSIVVADSLLVLVEVAWVLMRSSNVADSAAIEEAISDVSLISFSALSSRSWTNTTMVKFSGCIFL